MLVDIDFETYSELDVRAVGAYRYAGHPSTDVLICCYAFEGETKVHTWLPWMDQSVPIRLFKAVKEGATLSAHNAQFERAVWEKVLVHKYGAPRTTVSQYDCTAVRAATCSLPRSLERAGHALELKVLKNPEGKRLIQRFCKPRKPSKHDARTRIMPLDDKEEFKRFVDYCQDDVRAERALRAKLPELHPFEHRLFVLDFVINERGIPFDIDLVNKTVPVVRALEQKLKIRTRGLTGGINPTQVAKLQKWFEDQGFELDNLQSQTIQKLLLTHKKLPSKIRTLLELRVEAGKVSTKKLLAMLRVVDPETYRAYGTFLFKGAHTGRWSGKLIQPQNFIRGLLRIATQRIIFELLEFEDHTIFEMLFDWPLSAIAQCMRGFIRARPGYRLLVVDYAAIEARVLAWLANDLKMLKAFYEGRDVYRLMAAFLWKITPEAVSDEQRRLAKNLVLGCGYGLGWKQFIIYCAKQGIEISESTAKMAVKGYREMNRLVTVLWREIEDNAIAAVLNPGKTFRVRHLTFYIDGIYLCMGLPSGRRLYYPFPKVRTVERYGKPQRVLSYRTEYFGNWIRTDTWGGKLVENGDQAIACDFMSYGMLEAEEHDYPIIGTVHDELWSEKKNGKGNVKEFATVVSKVPPWGKGCPITAKGFEANRYRKD